MGDTSNRFDELIDRSFSERMVIYEKQLEEWNELAEQRKQIGSELSLIENAMMSWESKKPNLPPKLLEREWTSKNQKFKITGVIVEPNFSVAKFLKADGTTITVDKEKLIYEDQKYVENAFVEAVVYRNNLEKWEARLRDLELEATTKLNHLATIQEDKPVQPDREQIAKELKIASVLKNAGEHKVPLKRVDFPALVEIDIISKYCKPIESMSTNEQKDIEMLRRELEVATKRIPSLARVLEYVTKFPELFQNGGEYFKSGSTDSYVPYVKLRPGVWDQLSGSEKELLTDSIRKNVSTAHGFGIVEVLSRKDRWLHGGP